MVGLENIPPPIPPDVLDLKGMKKNKMKGKLKANTNGVHIGKPKNQ